MPFYRFSAASIAIDDGYNVIAPYVGTGRWLLLRTDIGVSSISDLQRVPVTERSPNMALYVSGANAWYSFKSAAATLPTDVVPIAGSGSWALNTEIVEVVPPYQKTFALREAIGHVDRIDFAIVETLQLPYKDAMAHADQIEFVLIETISYPHKTALARADRIDFTVLSDTGWVDVQTADWLDVATSAWLDGL